MMDWAVDTTDLVTNVFGCVKRDQFAKRRCVHMWRKWSRRLSVSRLLCVAISSPAVCWLGRIQTVAPRFYTVRATMTCPGLMIPSHVGLCYMPLDWTSAHPCIFVAAHHGSVCLAQADCRTLASAYMKYKVICTYTYAWSNMCSTRVVTRHSMKKCIYDSWNCLSA